MYYEEVTGEKCKGTERTKVRTKKQTPHFNSLAGESIKNSFIDTKKYY